MSLTTLFFWSFVSVWSMYVLSAWMYDGGYKYLPRVEQKLIGALKMFLLFSTFCRKPFPENLNTK